MENAGDRSGRGIFLLQSKCRFVRQIGHSPNNRPFLDLLHCKPALPAGIAGSVLAHWSLSAWKLYSDRIDFRAKPDSQSLG